MGIFPVSPRGQRNGRRAPYLFDQHPHPCSIATLNTPACCRRMGILMPEKWECPLVIHKGNDRIILTDVHEAMILLDQIPKDNRGPVFDMALRRCEAFRQGLGSEKSCQILVQAALWEGGMFSP